VDEGLLLLLFTLLFALLLSEINVVGVEALLGDEMVLGDEDERGVLFKFKSLSSVSLLVVLLGLVVVADVFASGFVLGILNLVDLNVIAAKADCGGVFGLIKLNMSCFFDLVSFLTVPCVLLSAPKCCSFACSLPAWDGSDSATLRGDGVVNGIELVNEGDGVRLFECVYD